MSQRSRCTPEPSADPRAQRTRCGRVSRPNPGLLSLAAPRGLCGLLFPLLLCHGLVTGQTAREWLQQGVEAFRAAQYDEAIDSFKQAVALEPKSVPALLHLAEAYLASPMETDKVKAGRDTLLRVLEIDVKNLKAVSNLAALSFAQVGGEGADLDDARKWQVRRLELSPDNKEAHYALGAIAWTRFYPAWQAARKSARLKPEDSGPFKDAKLRTALKAEWGATLQEGMDHLQRAIELDPTYADALTRLSVLIRERADLADNLYAWLAEVKKADALLKRAGR